MPVNRSRAEKMVAALPERARQLNADPRYHHLVDRLAVFGSLLTEKAVLGDVDVAVRYSARRARTRADWDQFAAAFPPPASIRGDWYARLSWPDTKFLRDLRTGIGMRVHDFSELEMLGCSYRVIFKRGGVGG